jgi:predicted ATPase/class 3 adenylate cyclase
MAELPSGTVTFLFTDLEGSTRHWEERPEAMRAALARHDAILEEAIAGHGGVVFSKMGDGMAAAFASPQEAIAGALHAQRGLQEERWPEAVGTLRARMGVHTGQGVLVEGQYLNQPLNRCARLMAIAHGGQVLVSGATEPLVRGGFPEGVGLVDLGEHRLRDLSEPIRVFQVRHGSLPANFPPLRSLEHYLGNLPLQHSSLVGREEELARVAEALEGSPVVTLTGVGGVGKTRLALQVAAEVLPRFKDGAWLCELASVRDPDRVADEVAGVFQVSARPGMSLEESLLAFFSDQCLLLVLDNCEHLLRPVAALVTRIEGACPGVKVLATSREGLNVRGEQILVVPSLGVPDEGAGLEVLATCEAVQLFIDRARAVKADFTLDAANAQGVAQVCTRLDGVPLAIELAAARIGAMTPSELTRRLDRRFRLLTGGDRVAIERHQTLRATIDWSYDLLTPPERQLLIRLSVFAGGFTIEAAEAVCSGDPIEEDDVLDLLATLVARSLVVATATGPDTRYRLLETIRQYGEERLAEAGETDTRRARHADYYIEFAGVAYRGISGPGQKEWGARLASEHDNLLAAMALALDTQDVDRAMGLLCSMPVLAVQVDNPVVFDPAAVLALPGAAEHPGSARALIDSASRAMASGDYGLALELVERARETEQRLGPASDPSGLGVEANGSILRAVVAMASGSLAEAAEWHLDVAERCRDVGLDGLQASFLGMSAYDLAWVDPEAAIVRATEGLTLARRSGTGGAIASNLQALAVALASSDPQRAAAVLAEADTVTPGSGADLTWAVFTATRLADWPSALRAADRLLDLDRRSGATALVSLSATFNAVARALADSQPETAAVLQGIVRGLAGPPSRGGATPTPPVGATELNFLIELFIQIRRDTSALLVEALGEAKMRELRAQGEAMDRDQASAYARTHIAEYLATLPPR